MKQQTPDMTKEIAEENQARAIVYNFLSSLFAKEVNTDLVAQLTSTEGQRFLSSLSLEAKLAAPIDKINTKLAQLDSEESLLELAADFCGLFLVDGRTSVSPYAGQYIANEPSDIISGNNKADKIQIFGELHQQMTEFLTNSNMQIHSDFPEPADHLAVMLAYISQLCLSTCEDNQISFIETYLMTWLADFTQQVKKHDTGYFYAAVAELTLELVKLELSD